MRFVVGLFLCCLSIASSAHHSRAEFSDEAGELEGQIVEVRWLNPHPVLSIRVVNERGEQEVWQIQTFGGAAMLGGPAGAAELFPEGSRIRIAGRASTRRPNYFLGTNALLEDGTEALLGGLSQPLWSERTVGGADNVGQQREVVDAANENRGIFRIWSMSERNAGVSRHLPFTDEAISARTDWDPIDNPISRCEPFGMPAAMMQPWTPIQFVDEGDTIVFRIRWSNTVRRIHMVGTSENREATALGYSVGHWEDNTLVIETTDISWPYFDSRGTSQTEAARITERYTLSDDQTRLDQNLTIIDPVTFTETATYGKYFMALGDAPMTAECHVQ